jgi:hypothetical protein
MKEGEALGNKEHLRSLLLRPKARLPSHMKG